jgi:hypothetical protein
VILLMRASKKKWVVLRGYECVMRVFILVSIERGGHFNKFENFYPFLSHEVSAVTGVS